MQPAEPPRVVIESPPPDSAASAPPASPALPAPAAPPAAPPEATPPAAAPPPGVPPLPSPPPAAIAPPPPAPTEADASLTAERPEYEMPALELGVGAFFMVGGGAGSYAGVTPFLVDEVARGVFLRPSAAIGGSLATEVSSTFLAGRIDTCARLPGRYASRNGLQLDLCGGPDVGVSFISGGMLPGNPPTGKTLPYVNIGPSLDLHGEIGNVALLLRGLVGINVARESFVDVAGTTVEQPILAWRLELAFSFGLRQ